MKKQHLKLTDSDLQKVNEMLGKGNLNARVHKRVLGLKKLHSGMSYKAVSQLVEISYPTIIKWSKLYKADGLAFLKDKPRSGRPTGISAEDRGKVTALACTSPPAGYQRWSLRLLADHLVELELVAQISHTDVGRILKKTNFSLIEKDTGASE